MESPAALQDRGFPERCGEWSPREPTMMLWLNEGRMLGRPIAVWLALFTDYALIAP